MYEGLNRILEWAQHYVWMWGNHFGWTDPLRDVWRALEQFLGG